MPPAALAVIPIAAGIAGAAGIGLGGGKGNTYQVDPYSKTPDYNPNAFQYGGDPSGADRAANAALGQQQAAQQQAGVYNGQQQTMFGTGLGAMDQRQQARLGQQQAAELMMARARGTVPSIAQMQANRAMGQAAAEQASAAAGARGPAAMALAQQNAAANVANLQGNIAGQSAIAAAQERLAAEQAAMGAYSGLGAQDLGAAQTAFGAGAQSGQLGLGQGQLGLGYGELQNRIREAQLRGGMTEQQILMGSRENMDQINSNIRGQNVARDDRRLEAMMNMIARGASASGGMMSGGGGGAPGGAGGGQGMTGGGGGGGGGGSGVGDHF